MHLNDAAQTEQAAYRREWNGGLRLFNLLQFLPNAWWTTALGVKRDVYPEFASGEPEPEVVVSAEWADPISLAPEGLRPTMRELATQGFPPPEVGFELMNPSGHVIAEAELAWEPSRVAVLLPHQDQKSFVDAAWRTFQAEDPALASRLRESLAEGQP